MLTRFRDGTRLATIFVAVFLFMALGAAAAQAVPDWNDTVDTLEGAVGLHYGKVAGHGLSFRLPIQWWLYFQITGGIWHTSDHKQHNFGFQFNYLLRQDQRTRIYIAAGTAYFHDDEQVQPDVWQEESNWNVGAGVGVEYLVGKRWSIKVDGDFAYFGDSGDITVVPQVGVYYYW